uniref:Nascent polypeptide-associated complex subunit alpha n=1 Tax=Lygus hesperus TaxID=30085 RepID=A0A0A9YB06_LYGHE
MPKNIVPEGDETSPEYTKKRQEWLRTLSQEDYIMVSEHKISRNERKGRKAFSKLKLERVDDIYRIVVRQNEHTIFIVPDVDVYRVVGTNTYVFFGTASTDDSTQVIQQLAQMTLQSRMKESGKAATDAKGTAAELEDLMNTLPKEQNSDAEAAEVPAVDEAAETSTENTFTEDDIKTVMAQTECSHEAATEALKKYGSTIEAIMGIIE